MHERIHDPGGAATTYHNLGVLLQRRGDHDKAVSHYAQSLELKRLAGDQEGLAIAHSQLAVLAAERGDTDAAIGHHLHALALRLQTDVPPSAFDLKQVLAYRAGAGPCSSALLTRVLEDPAQAAAVDELMKQGAASADRVVPL